MKAAIARTLLCTFLALIFAGLGGVGLASAQEGDGALVPPDEEWLPADLEGFCDYMDRRSQTDTEDEKAQEMFEFITGHLEASQDIVSAQPLMCGPAVCRIIARSLPGSSGFLGFVETFSHEHEDEAFYVQSEEDPDLWTLYVSHDGHRLLEYDPSAISPSAPSQ